MTPVWALLYQTPQRAHVHRDTVRVIVHDTVHVLQPDGAKLTDWIALALTAALVVTAVVSIVVEVRRERRHRDDLRRQDADRVRAADARISAMAYMTRRTLRTWVEEAAPESTLLAAGWIQEVQPNFGATEGRFTDMMAQAPDSSPGVVTAVREAFVLFATATNALNHAWKAGVVQSSLTNVVTAHQQITASAAALDAAIDRELRDH